MKGKVVLYTVTGCQFCKKAKNILNDNNITFIQINLDEYSSIVRENLRNTCGKSSVPQIYFNDRYVGGFSDLENLIKNKEKWDELIAFVTNEELSSSALPLPLESDKLEFSTQAAENNKNCISDPYEAILTEMEASGLVNKANNWCSKQYMFFVGHNLINWLQKEKGQTIGNAMEIGQELINEGLVFQSDNSISESVFTPDKKYTLYDWSMSTALNAGPRSSQLPRPASEISQLLRRHILKLYEENISIDGLAVDYVGISESRNFAQYTSLTKELHRVSIQELSREETLSFFINIYNALVIHGFVVYGHPRSTFSRWKFFNNTQYIIGNYLFSLQDIENGILRSNRKGVGMIYKPFAESDPRLSIALDSVEPLIHFALVCGAKGCPAIKTYSCQTVYTELQVAAEAFLESDSGIHVIPESKEIKLSQIFNWYQQDFGSNKHETLQWIADKMLPGNKKNELISLLKENNIKITYLPYDWSLNST